MPDSKRSTSEPASDWAAFGFAAPPSPVTFSGTERLYRIWGGSSERLGAADSPYCFFTPIAPRSRRDAERLCNVMLYGNACRTLSEFRALGGTTGWIGPVDPGEPIPSPWWSGRGVQVLVRRTDAQGMPLTGEWPLLNDLRGVFVHPYRPQPDYEDRHRWS